MSTQIMDAPRDVANADDAEDMIDAAGVMISRAEIEDAEIFLETDRGSAWLQPLLSGSYYSAWYDHQRSPYDGDFARKVAEAILEARANATCSGEVEDAIEKCFGDPQCAEDVFDEEYAAAARRAIQELAADTADAADEAGIEEPEFDEEAWLEAVRTRVVDHMRDGDDSSVMDMIGDCDRCEIVVKLGSTDDYVSMLDSHNDFGRMEIDNIMQDQMSALGYTVADYRRMSGSREKGHGLVRGLRKRAKPIVTPAQLKDLVENAGGNFAFVLYACVPLTDLAALPLGPGSLKRVMLSSYSVAAYDWTNGTFHDVRIDEPIMLDGPRWRLQAPWGYLPSDICGLHMPAYHARIMAIDPAEPA